MRAQIPKFFLETCLPYYGKRVLGINAFIYCRCSKQGLMEIVTSNPSPNVWCLFSEVRDREIDESHDVIFLVPAPGFTGAPVVSSEDRHTPSDTHNHMFPEFPFHHTCCRKFHGKLSRK